MIPPLQSPALSQPKHSRLQSFAYPEPFQCPNLHSPGRLGYLDKLISGVCLSCKNNLLPDSKLVWVEKKWECVGLKTPPTSFLSWCHLSAILLHDFLYFATALTGELASLFGKPVCHKWTNECDSLTNVLDTYWDACRIIELGFVTITAIAKKREKKKRKWEKYSWRFDRVKSRRN